MTGSTPRAMRWWDIAAVMLIEERVFPTTAWTPAQFWSELAQDDREYLVVESSERLVAYGGVMLRRPTADIQTLAVDPDFRRRGIARALLRSLIGSAERAQCTEMLLEVRADNPEAVALYRSEGFEPIARRTGYYGPGQDALVMRRRPA